MIKMRLRRGMLGVGTLYPSRFADERAGFVLFTKFASCCQSLFSFIPIVRPKPSNQWSSIDRYWRPTLVHSRSAHGCRDAEAREAPNRPPRTRPGARGT